MRIGGRKCLQELALACVLHVPVFSAHLTRPRAARSLTDPPGFMNSAFPRISHPVSSESELMRICGVEAE
jgi:hypothetical protein